MIYPFSLTFIQPKQWEMEPHIEFFIYFVMYKY